MNHLRHLIKQLKHRTIILLVNIFSFSLQNTSKNVFVRLETQMFVSPAQAPYEGVYQRQPTGLPRAEYVPQYPEMPSAPMQYPPQPAYQTNTNGGQMYIPQNNQMPPSYEQSQSDFQQKKRD